MNWQHKLDDLFAVDLRSLAAVRIGTALVLLYDLAHRAGDLTAHYTDAGVLPREGILGEGGSLWKMTPHLLGGSTAFQASLFVVAGVLAAMLLVGYRTLPATIASWILVVSLHQRNPLLLFGGDDVVKYLLFWGIFVPWGARFSIDRARAAGRGLGGPSANPLRSGGTAALMLQVAFIYLFTALLKTGVTWQRDYTAIQYALNIDTFVGPLGPLLYRFPGLMKVSTFLSYWLEMLAPFLLFFPFHTRRLRLLAVAGLALLHIGILLTMRVHFFPWINLVSLLVFIPQGFWDRFGKLQPTAAPTEAELWLEKLQSRAAAVLIVYVFFLNVGLPPALESLGSVLNIEQRWNMFAPNPFRNDGWFVVEGVTNDGKHVDLLRPGEPLSWDKPRDPWVLYENERWRKYYRRMWLRRGRDNYRYFAPWACRNWRSEDGDAGRLVSVEPIYMLERTLHDFGTAPIERRSMGRSACD